MFSGTISKNVQLFNSAASLEITKGKKRNSIVFNSAGVVVAFNGGSEVHQNSPQFKDAEKLAATIAQRGGIIMNGGRNGGIMEATCRGAKQHCLGVLFREQIGRQSGYGQKLFVPSPLARLELLTTIPPYVVVYPGGIGTLQELITVLVSRKNAQIFKLASGPKLFLHESWRGFIRFIEKHGFAKRAYTKNIAYFRTGSDIIKRLPLKSR